MRKIGQSLLAFIVLFFCGCQNSGAVFPKSFSNLSQSEQESSQFLVKVSPNINNKEKIDNFLNVFKDHPELFELKNIENSQNNNIGEIEIKSIKLEEFKGRGYVQVQAKLEVETTVYNKRKEISFSEEKKFSIEHKGDDYLFHNTSSRSTTVPLVGLAVDIFDFATFGVANDISKSIVGGFSESQVKGELEKEIIGYFNELTQFASNTLDPEKIKTQEIKNHYQNAKPEIKQAYDSEIIKYYQRKRSLSALQEMKEKFPEINHENTNWEVLARNYAVNVHNIETYKEYLEKFPYSKYEGEITNSLHDLEFLPYQRKDSLQAYSEFIQKFPHNSHHREAQGRVEDLEYFAFRDKDSIESYAQFIEKYPGNKHIQEARLRLEDLEYQPFKSKGTISSFEKFLNEYPQNKHIQEAKLQIENLEWEATQQNNTSNGYSNFIEKYPYSKYKNSAETVLAYFRAKESDSISDFEDFYIKYDKAKNSKVGYSEIEHLNIRLKKLAKKQELASGYILLYKQEEKDDYLQEGIKYIKNAKEEAFFAEKYPDKFFKIVGKDESRAGHNQGYLEGVIKNSQKAGIGGALIGLYFPHVKQSTKPVFKFGVKSLAKFGVYNIDVKYILTAEFKSVSSGIAWFTPPNKEWKEDLIKEVSYRVSPGKVEIKNVEFSDVTTHSTQSAFVVSVETTGKFVDINSRIESIALY